MSLRCTWTAGTEITVQWGKGGATISPDARITITVDSLVIIPAQRSDAGEYTCTASNAISAQTATRGITVYCEFTVNGALGSHCSHGKKQLLTATSTLNHAPFIHFLCFSTDNSVFMTFVSQLVKLLAHLKNNESFRTYSTVAHECVLLCIIMLQQSMQHCKLQFCTNI